MKSLSIITSQIPEPIPGCLIGDPFGGDLQPKPVAEMQHSFGDRRIFKVLAKPANEGAIDFYPIDRQLLEQRQS